ncbi:hypothetical protein [Sporosarcina phage Lietuvens]|nr:hypothetical protein [Sporosarcina phage Lietuvens]
MTKYTSKYKELAFYVDGKRKQFSNGVYDADDKREQAVLNTLKDAVAEKPAEEVKPAPKADNAKPTKAKAPAKK